MWTRCLFYVSQFSAQPVRGHRTCHRFSVCVCVCVCVYSHTQVVTEDTRGIEQRSVMVKMRLGFCEASINTRRSPRQ
jgi:hypothetical protein